MFHILPNEMMVQLTEYLNLTELFSFSQVNKHTSAISHYAINRNRLARYRIEVNFLKQNLDKIQAIESVRYRASLSSLLLYIGQQLDSFQKSGREGYLKAASTILDMINNKLINGQLKQHEGTNIALTCISRLPRKAIVVHQAKFETAKRLELKDNCLESLPGNISVCQALESLNLYDNPITQLPDSIGTLPLKYFYLSGGCLSTLPSCIYQLKHIEWLSLGNMGISTLSAEIKNLRTLTWLYLENNHLKTLPSELTTLRKLTEIFLNKNELMVCQPYGVWDYIKQKSISIRSLLSNQNIMRLSSPFLQIMGTGQGSRPYLPLLRYSQDMVEREQPLQEDPVDALSKDMQALDLNTFHA